MTKNPKEDQQNGCFVWFVRVTRSVNERWAMARNAVRKRFYRDKGKPMTSEDLENETGTPDLIVTKIPVRALPKMAMPRPQGLDSFNRGFSTKDGHTNHGIPNALSTSGTDNHVTSRIVDGEADEDEEVTKFVFNVLENAQKMVAMETRVHRGNIEQSDQCSDTVSVTSSVLSDIAMRTVHESLTNVIEDLQNEARTVIDETSSMSSGVISDIAMRTVHESLTNVVEDLQNEARTVIDETSSMSSGAISVLAEAAVSSSLTKILTEQDMNQSARSNVSIPRTVSEVLDARTEELKNLLDGVINFVVDYFEYMYKKY